MMDSVLQTIKQHNMLKQGDDVIVGLSGGADSVALLCVLHNLKGTLGITLSACHINHNLRGEESMRDELFCQKLCARLSIPLAVKSVDVLSYCEKSRRSVEDGARVLRYEALQSAAAGGKIATAHTLSDNAETLLLNLLRGAALEGLCGIPPVRDNIVRPLISCTRAAVEDYLSKTGQDYVTDSSNISGDYKRNRIRHEIMPLLKAINPSFEMAVLRTTGALRADRAMLSQTVEKALEAAALPDMPAALPDGAQRLTPYLPRQKLWSREMLERQPKPIRLRCYKNMLTASAQRYDAYRLELIDKMLKIGSGAVQLSGRNTLFCKDGMVYIQTVAEPPEIIKQQISLEGDKIQLSKPLSDEYIIRICEIDRTEIKFFVNKCGLQFKNAVDYDKINKIITLRSREPGDRIELAGRNCTQTLKKLLNALAVPVSIRDSLAVLADRDGPVWVEGLGVSQRVAVSDGTRRAILVTVEKER